ncbi:hypothetical protein K3722_07530 [Leisingera caerulea]|uniref:Uncharacterized protein n=1 Tax=Leisingera caerulea TaxID=506591 RepID=A0ABY5X051_LEICA|nr:hypothetical protein [Leisingera caerulea]UWQ59972.1 hypothetical protein K3722_07530 [Leisingera caerulea]
MSPKSPTDIMFGNPPSDIHQPSPAELRDWMELNGGPKVETFADLAAVDETMVPVGGLLRCIETGAVYERAPGGASDAHLDYTGGTGKKWYVRSDVYDPRFFGWSSGDMLPYLQQFADGDWETFRAPRGSEWTLSDTVTIVVDDLTRSKTLDLEGSVRTNTKNSAKILIQQNDKSLGVLKYVYINGGTTHLHSDNNIGFHIKDTRNVRFFGHEVRGDPSLLTSRGVGVLIENENAYAERFMWQNCSGVNLRHTIQFHFSGGVDGGFSFARAMVENMTLNGGVAGEAQIALTTDVDFALGVTNPQNFTLGETVTQAVTGASGTVLGWPEAQNVLYIGSATGDFNATDTITGVTSGKTRTPSSVVSPRLPNVYDSTFENITGNLEDGVIVMDLGGGMVGTRIMHIACEAEAGTRAYAFRVLKNSAGLDNWTFERPSIGDIDLSNQMDLFHGTPDSKAFSPLKIYEGLRLIPASNPPDILDGVMSYADGVGWNPGGIGEGDGGAGCFLRQSGSWQRVVTFVQTNAANLADANNPINTTGKYYGKPVFSASTNAEYRATGAAPSASWKSQLDGSLITPV